MKENEVIRKTAEATIQQMESTGFMTEKFMTNAEKLSGCMGYQSTCLNRVFNVEHATNLRFEDIIKHFKSVAAQKGLSDDSTVLEAIEDMEKIAKEIAIMISGVNGEKQVSKVIQYAHRKVIAIPNVILSEGEDKTEIDQVLITSTGLVILEVKNYKKDITITEGGQILGPNGKKYSDKCLGEQMNVKRHLLTSKLKKLIKEEELNIPVHVDSMVVFSNSSISVEDKYRREKFCFKSTLPYEIDEHRSTVLYSDNQMQTLSYLVKELMEEDAKYEVEMDFNRVRKTFAEALVKIETPVEPAEAHNEPEEIVVPEPVCFSAVPVTKKNMWGACLALFGAGLLGSGLTYLTCKKLKIC